MALQGIQNPINEPENIVVDHLETLLQSAVNQQMMADVPLGAFLSGGVDSSTIVSLMQNQSSQPIKTFTIGFSEKQYSEANHANAVAHHLGTDHTEFIVTSNDALDVISDLPKIYCEPFGDSSQIPTYLVSKLARQSVTVSLSGDAGDELFAGYNRYILAKQFWGRISKLPINIRSVLGSLICGVSPSVLNSFADPLQSIFTGPSRLSNIGEKLHKGARALSAKGIEDYYLNLVTHWQPEEIVLNGRETTDHLQDNLLALDQFDDVQKMMIMDTMTYLPDDILVKVDRAAMAVSLESRVPLLDHRVVEYAWRIPQSMKLKDNLGKWAMREVLYRYVPRHLIDRPKMGFSLPIDSWLRGPLKDWAENLLDETRLRNDGFLNPKPIRKKWHEHLSKKRDSQHMLWNVLMFQAWLEEQ